MSHHRPNFEFEDSFIKKERPLLAVNKVFLEETVMGMPDVHGRLLICCIFRIQKAAARTLCSSLFLSFPVMLPSVGPEAFSEKQEETHWDWDHHERGISSKWPTIIMVAVISPITIPRPSVILAWMTIVERPQ